MTEEFKQLNEISLSGIAKKQKDITKLFPSFYDRVGAVADKGGVRLMALTSNLWEFRVHSGTENSKWYGVMFHIKDIEKLLEKHVGNKELWTKDGKNADLRKVSRAIFFDADVQVNCDCPAFLYWGHAFVTSKSRYDAKYGRKETRPPNKRNPKQYGMLCKHLQALLKVLPFYNTTVANWLKTHYKSTIREIQNRVRKEGKVEEEPKVASTTSGQQEEEANESKISRLASLVLDDLTKPISKDVLTEKPVKTNCTVSGLQEALEDVFKPAPPEEVEKRRIEFIKKQFDPKLLKDNGDGTYDYNGGIDVSDIELTSLTQLPYKLRRVSGKFSCNNNKLTTLDGAPEVVGGGFSCSFNNLATLKGAPQEVRGWFYCDNNNLTTLKGAPEKVGGKFYCYYNKLTTLEGAPEKVGGGFYCSRNNLTTLKGGPEVVGGDFYCQYNNLTSLEGGPEVVGGDFYCQYNNLTSLEGAPREVGENFYCGDNSVSEQELKKTIKRSYLK